MEGTNYDGLRSVVRIIDGISVTVTRSLTGGPQREYLIPSLSGFLMGSLRGISLTRCPIESLIRSLILSLMASLVSLSASDRISLQGSLTGFLSRDLWRDVSTGISF